MAREDTFKKRDNEFLANKMDFEIDTENFQNPFSIEKENKNDDKIIVENIKPNNHNDESSINLHDVPKKEIDENMISTETTISNSRITKKRPNALSFMSDTEEVVAKTFKIRKDVVDAFDSLFEDSRGRKIPGVRGMMSKVATNAFIKELIELEVLDSEYLDKLEKY